MTRTSSPNMIALELPSTSEQEGILRAYTISTSINNMLFGVYLIIYIFTICLYRQKNRKSNKVVVIATTVLFATIVVQHGLALFNNDVIFIKHGSTRESVYTAATGTTPPGLHLLSDILLFGAFIIVDFLMVWRCYHVWGDSWRVILIPSTLLVIECGIMISLIVVSSLHISHTTPSVARLLNTLQIPLYCLPAAISIMCTYLIAHRIFSTPLYKDSSKDKKTQKFRKIIDIIVQSSVVYTIILVCAVSTDVTVPVAERSVTKECIFSFISRLLTPISGIVTTLMVARVGMLNTRFGDTTMDEKSPSNFVSIQFVKSDRIQTSSGMIEEAI